MSTLPFDEPEAHGFQRRLGLFDCTMLVAGSMIGSVSSSSRPTCPRRRLVGLVAAVVGGHRRDDPHGRPQLRRAGPA